jgi:hypothetical protein
MRRAKTLSLLGVPFVLMMLGPVPSQAQPITASTPPPPASKAGKSPSGQGGVTVSPGKPREKKTTKVCVGNICSSNPIAVGVATAPTKPIEGARKGLNVLTGVVTGNKKNTGPQVRDHRKK